METSDLSQLAGVSEVIDGRHFAVTNVARQQANAAAPEFHAVEARAAPALRVDLALPRTWNGRLYVVGNGGYAGERANEPMRNVSRDKALAVGFAVAGSNTGHDAEVDPLGTFAGDADKLADYAHRAVHQTAVLAKRLLERIYGAPPHHAYFEGCSTGGRQALISAQRYPDDFDGIIAGAPVLDFTNNQLWGIRAAQILAGSGVDANAMQVVADAVARHHGVPPASPLLEDPARSDFDVLQHVPIGGDTPQEGKLTRRQAEAIAALYATVDLGGDSFPGLAIGTEAKGVYLPGTPAASGWDGWYFAAEGGVFSGMPDGTLAAFGETFVTQMLGFQGGWRDFDFSDRGMGEIAKYKAMLNATDPDLTVFAARGGRLMLYHGYADAGLTALRTVEYFKAIEETMGADRAADFVRFYLIPGMFHCMGGYGPDRFDMLAPLIAWVEEGTPPGSIIATDGPLDGPTMCRPLCPYPSVARYSGIGDPGDAGSYVCIVPE